MEFKENDYYPEGEPKTDLSEEAQIPDQAPEAEQPERSPRKPFRISVGVLISVVCIVTAISVLLTFLVTNNANRSFYSAILKSQAEELERLRPFADLVRPEGDASTGDGESGDNTEPSNGGIDATLDSLKLLSMLVERYSYYAGDVSNEELLAAVMKAYVEATGDLYAAYYTEEEYAELSADREGESVGIGVSVTQTVTEVEGYQYAVMQVTAIYRDGPASGSELRLGDCIYAVKADGVYQSITEIGYDKAISLIKGEAGTAVELAVFRAEGGTQTVKEISIVRDHFESESVSYTQAAQDPTVGIIQIHDFYLKTPQQLKAAVKDLQSKGVQHFVFDVRNNPGGDLQSIKATLTYFLQKGDLILSEIDRNGKVGRSYYAEKMAFSDEYASCSVAEEEIGMFADLDMVVICNGNTASAAEVFTATLRDYGLATVVGEQTFGKGIMQSFFPMALFGSNYSGYVKMTTYAYVTKCGVTYHDIGITPDHVEPLSDEAKAYNFYLLPQEVDNQLQAAIAKFS